MYFNERGEKGCGFESLQKWEVPGTGWGESKTYSKYIVLKKSIFDLKSVLASKMVQKW